jgi:hypothetical protein
LDDGRLVHFVIALLIQSSSKIRNDQNILFRQRRG